MNVYKNINMNISFPHILIFVPDWGSMILFCKGTDSISLRLSKSKISVASTQKQP